MNTIAKTIEATLSELLGKGGENLLFWQTMLRALIIYILALLIVRIGKKRLFGRSTAFDVIMGIILGSVFSRAINGSAPFFGTIMAGLVLIVVHWLFAAAAFRSNALGKLIKGESDTLIKNGEIQWENMRKHDVTEKDLKESLRLSSKTDDLSGVKLAILERNGNISFQQEKQPKIIELGVQDGVQRIRIEI